MAAYKNWGCSFFFEIIYTHPFNGPFSGTTFSGTTWVSQYQKGKTNLDFTEARDSEWVASARPYASLHLASDNHASTPPLSFYRPDALPVAQPTASKHLRQFWNHIIKLNFYKDQTWLLQVDMTIKVKWCIKFYLKIVMNSLSINTTKSRGNCIVC